MDYLCVYSKLVVEFVNVGLVNLPAFNSILIFYSCI